VALPCDGCAARDDCGRCPNVYGLALPSPIKHLAATDWTLIRSVPCSHCFLTHTRTPISGPGTHARAANWARGKRNVYGPFCGRQPHAAMLLQACLRSCPQMSSYAGCWLAACHNNGLWKILLLHPCVIVSVWEACAAAAAADFDVLVCSVSPWPGHHGMLST
jgi:hypothetical protein